MSGKLILPAVALLAGLFGTVANAQASPLPSAKNVRLLDNATSGTGRSWRRIRKRLVAYATRRFGAREHCLGVPLRLRDIKH